MSRSKIKMSEEEEKSILRKSNSNFFKTKFEPKGSKVSSKVSPHPGQFQGQAKKEKQEPPVAGDIDKFFETKIYVSLDKRDFPKEFDE
jgi:hypothetical protein